MRFRIRSFIRCYAIVAALATMACTLPSVGCSAPAAVAGRSTANLTAPGVKALQAKEAVKYLDIIRDTAQDAEAAKVLPLATAEKVTRWHKALSLTIDQTPQGWQAVALKGLDELQKVLSPSERALLDPYIQSARIIYLAVVS